MTPEEFKAKVDAERHAKALAHLNAEADRQEREALEAEAYVRLRREYPTRAYKDLCALAQVQVEAEMLRRAVPVCDHCDEPIAEGNLFIDSDPWGGNVRNLHENCAEKLWDSQQERLMEET